MSELVSRPIRVFLCYSSSDKAPVRELYKRLDTEDWIDAWLDEEKLYPGQDWNLEIEKAVETADVILVCLTRHSVNKEGYVQRELKIVLDHADYKPEGTLFIIPVRLEECEPPRRLKRWQYADYFPSHDRDRAYGRLLVSLSQRAKALGLISDKPPSPPENPIQVEGQTETGFSFKEAFTRAQVDLNNHSHKQVKQSQPTTRVLVILEGDKPFTQAEEESFVFVLSRIVNLEPTQIRILQISEGSVRILLELPQDAAERLYSLYQANDHRINSLGGLNFSLKHVSILSGSVRQETDIEEFGNHAFLTTQELIRHSAKPLLRILFVTPYIPGGVHNRSYNFIRSLTRLGHKIHLVALQPKEDNSPTITPLTDLCETVDVFRVSRWRSMLNSVYALWSRLPLQALYVYHPQAERQLQQLVSTGRFDVVHVEHIRGVPLVNKLNKIPRVLDAVDSITLLFEEYARGSREIGVSLFLTSELNRVRHFEARIPFMFDRTIVSSRADADRYQELAGKSSAERIVILPSGVDPTDARLANLSNDSTRVLFVADMSRPVDVASAMYIANEIMPHIWIERPDTVLTVVCKEPPSNIRALRKNPRIAIIEESTNPQTYFANASLFIAPPYSSPGGTLSTIDAMAHGVPVVATRETSIALSAKPEVGILIGDSPKQLASHALSLIEDPNLRRQIGYAARRYIEQEYDWLKLTDQLVSVYQDAIAVHH